MLSVQATALCIPLNLNKLADFTTKAMMLPDTDENLIISNQDIRVDGIDCKDNRLAASLCFNNMEKHIAIFNLPVQLILSLPTAILQKNIRVGQRLKISFIFLLQAMQEMNIKKLLQ